VTREQQAVTKKLEVVQAEWLKTFGWKSDGRLWRHPKIDALGVSCPFTTWDAMSQTLAEPTLGWPER
jgi:hypothetical protein